MYRLVLRDSFKNIIKQRSLQGGTTKRSFKDRKYKVEQVPLNIHFIQAGYGTQVIVFLTPFALFGGAMAYAKHNPEFRKTVETNLPGSEYVIKVCLREGKPPLQVNDLVNNAKQSFDEMVERVNKFFSHSNNSDQTKKPKKTSYESSGELFPSMDNRKDSSAKDKTKSTKTVSNDVPKPTPQEVSSQIALPANILELEHAVEMAATEAVREYNKAIGILKSFNDDVRNTVNEAIEHMDITKWSTLKNRTSARDTAIASAERMARDAIDKIEKCEQALAKVSQPENRDQVLSIRKKIHSLLQHINVVKDELYRNKDLANMSEKYWKNVEKARNYFVDEIESIFPGLDLSQQKLNISQDDLDIFIMHAYSHVLALQKELERLQTDGELRLKRAIDSIRGDNDSEAVKAQLDYLLESEKHKMLVDNQKRIYHIRADYEKQLRQQLKNQAEAHLDHLNDVMTLKESELKRLYAQELENKMASEKANYKLQLASMLGKMRGMDAALQARAESERSAHQAQALWAACQALWATVRTGEPGEHWKNKLRPLKNEIRAIAKVAEGDELVNVIINNLSIEATERGVFPEDALRERFLNVERIARKLAIVPSQGASLPKYFLSYLQSIFILKPSEPISQDELQNKPFDYSKLDTYDILNRARYYVDRGDLMMALKYMNLLDGAPRKVSSEWLKETRLLLETQQAANTLMAHAAASGLLYL